MPRKRRVYPCHQQNITGGDFVISESEARTYKHKSHGRVEEHHQAKWRYVALYHRATHKRGGKKVSGYRSDKRITQLFAGSSDQYIQLSNQIILPSS